MPPRTKLKGPAGPGGRWHLSNAKVRFSELIRKAQASGPQYVTVHGRDAVVVLSIEEFTRIVKPQTGQALVDAMTRTDLADVKFGQVSFSSPVRDVTL